MATIAAPVLDLNNKGRRRQGMTRQTPYASLHGPRLRGQRVDGQDKEETARERRGGADRNSTRAERGGSEDDIFAPPQDSSDESDAGAIDKEDGNAWSSSDELEPLSRNRKAPVVTSSAPARTFHSESIPPNNADVRRRSGVSAGTVSQDGVEKNGKRKSDQLSRRDNQDDDDDILSMFSMSQPKKICKQYSAAGNVHLSASNVRKTGKPNGEPSTKPDTKSKFRRFDTSGSSAKEKPKFRKPATSTLPRSQDVSPKSTGDGDNESKPKGKQRTLKTVSRPSPKKKATFRTVPTTSAKTGEDASAELTTRPRREPRKRGPLSSDVDMLNTQAGANLVLDTGRRLGVPDLTIKMPPSSAMTGSPTARSSATSPLSSPATSILDDDDLIAALSPHDQHPPPSSSSSLQASLCPLCRMPVDRLFLEEATGTKRLTIAEQTDFCRRHRLRSAHEDWIARGLPEIDWSQLGERVTAHHDVLAEIIEGTRPSFYRNAYDELLKKTNARSGRHRTAQQSLAQGDDVEEMAAPGYYGSRGARIIIENIMTQFASHLRRRAPNDPLISGKGFTLPLNAHNSNVSNGGGVPTTSSSGTVGSSGTGIDGYVQAVLVPETATLLVLEDLEKKHSSSSSPITCTAETARQVLRDTVELGRLLCEELEDDDIQDGDDDDDDAHLEDM